MLDGRHWVEAELCRLLSPSRLATSPAPPSLPTLPRRLSSCLQETRLTVPQPQERTGWPKVSCPWAPGREGGGWDHRNDSALVGSDPKCPGCVLQPAGGHPS